jgi:hypothetical protein
LVVVGCASEDADSLHEALDVLRRDGLEVELCPGLDQDPRRLSDAIDRHEGRGLYVLCRSSALGREQVEELREILLARHVPFARTLTVAVGGRGALADRIRSGLRRASARNSGPNHAAGSGGAPVRSATPATEDEEPTVVGRRDALGVPEALELVASQPVPLPPLTTLDEVVLDEAEALDAELGEPELLEDTNASWRDGAIGALDLSDLDAGNTARTRMPPPGDVTAPSPPPALITGDTVVGPAPTMRTGDTVGGQKLPSLPRDPSGRLMLPPLGPAPKIDLAPPAARATAPKTDPAPPAAPATTPETEPATTPFPRVTLTDLGATRSPSASSLPPLPATGSTLPPPSTGSSLPPPSTRPTLLPASAPAPSLPPPPTPAPPLPPPPAPSPMLPPAATAAPPVAAPSASPWASSASGSAAALSGASAGASTSRGAAAPSASFSYDDAPIPAHGKALPWALGGVALLLLVLVVALAVSNDRAPSEVAAAGDEAAPGDDAPSSSPAQASPGPEDAEAAEAPGETAVYPVVVALESRKVRALDVLLIASAWGQPSDWSAAVAYCNALEVEGLRDWRLPHIGELHSLAEANMIARDMYWSSTAADTFGDGHMAWNARRGHALPHSEDAVAVCVRGGASGS